MQRIFSQPITLDASGEDDIRRLIEIGEVAVEDMDESDDNTMNKIVEKLTYTHGI